MTTNYHVCLDIRGALKNWNARQFRGLFKHDNGKTLSVSEAKDFLMDELAKGRAVLPYGQCDNFDYQTGCLGHPVTPESIAPGDKPDKEKS